MQPSAGESDESIEAGFGFFISCCESAEALEFAEAAFDAIALFVEVFVVFALLLAVAFGWDHGFGSHRFDVLYDGVGIVALVGQHGLGLVLAQQSDGLSTVVDLSAGDKKVYRQTVLVGEQMNLGRQTSSGTPQSLV